MKLITFLLILLLSSLKLILCKFLRANPRCNIFTLCSDKSQLTGTSDVNLIECILRDQESNFDLECKKFVFEYAHDFFEDDVLRRTLSISCSEDIKKLDCNTGQKLIFCILDQKEKLLNHHCQLIVQRLEYLISTNFALISDFHKLCETDIKQLCNYDSQNNFMIFDGDNVILDCLQKKVDHINNTVCLKEILILSEIQGENMKLDDYLLKFCDVDKKHFCSDLSVEANSYLMYKCLQEFINSPSLSFKCREELFKREKFISRDLKIGKEFVRACRNDIRKNRCRRMISDDKSVRLAQMLLCLENSIHNGSKISHDCHSEMIIHRKLLLEDYQLSPDVVSTCTRDIEKFCNNLNKDEETIHCLLEYSRPKRSKRKTVSAQCQRSLENLLKITDIGEDWRIDPILRYACEGVVKILCNKTLVEEKKIMSCLMDNINSRKMKMECRNALMQIQYFVARDFNLDPQLFDSCHEDAHKLCHAKNSWNDDSEGTDLNRGSLILPCLYRYVYNNKYNNFKTNLKLTTACEKQVRRVMRQRAIEVELMPEVMESCIDDLTLYCSKKTGPGEEILCLQDKYSTLKKKCQLVIGNFTEAKLSDINLNPIIKTYCRNIINLFCADELQGVRDSSSDIMSCLIKHKYDAKMKTQYKCKAAIEHFQLINLNEYHFTIAFKTACRPYVIHYCSKTFTKSQIVKCLSEITQNDTLKDERYKLSKECRYQLKTQLSQQREFVEDLNLKLKSVCEKDIKVLCIKRERKSEILECLEENINLLNPQCHNIVFRIQQHDFKDSSTNYTLLTTCKTMIKQYCKNYNSSQILICLKKFKDERLFDNNCKSIILKRMIEQSVDYRLNPALQQGCSRDINKFCLNVLNRHLPNTEFNGKILQCLKIKFREKKLRKECETQLSIVLKEAALNYKLNPLLRNLCVTEINNFCATEIEIEQHKKNTGQVEECLKVAFLDGLILSRACRLEVAGLIEEAKADIHVDPLLHQACILDITKYCADVVQGAGRIIQCLQTVLSSRRILQPDCKFKLTQRIEMFNNIEVALNAEPKNFEELINHVNRSPLRKYFIICLFSIVGMMFMLGLFCDRVTHRVTGLKNK